MPGGQAALLALRDVRRDLADDVLSRARRHYLLPARVVALRRRAQRRLGTTIGAAGELALPSVPTLAGVGGQPGFTTVP
jgi:hypothetical protein